MVINIFYQWYTWIQKSFKFTSSSTTTKIRSYERRDWETLPFNILLHLFTNYFPIYSVITSIWLNGKGTKTPTNTHSHNTNRGGLTSLLFKTSQRRQIDFANRFKMLRACRCTMKSRGTFCSHEIFCELLLWYN